MQDSAIDSVSKSSANKSPSDIPPRDLEMSNASRWWVVLLCALVCLLDGYDMVVAPISVPVLAQAWGLEATAFTAALTGTVLGMALGAVFIAPLGDRFGRRPLILVTFTFVGIFSLLTPLATTVLELTLFRLVTGLGMGASIANALALAAEYAIPRLRSRIVACVYSMSAVGSVVGGLVAPPLLASWGWQGLYVAGGVVPLLAVPLLFFSLPESRRFLEVRAESLSVANTDAARRDGFFHGVKLLLAQPYRSRTLMLWTLYFLSTFTVYVISSWLPTLLHLFGWSIDNSVRAITTFSFGGIVGGFLLGWLVDRGRIRFALFASFVGTGLAILVLNVVPAEVWIWMLIITVMGAGMIGLSYTVAALAALVYPTELRAGGIGTATAIGRMGATVAPVVGGSLLALGWSAVEIFTGLLVPMVVGIVIVFLFSRLFDARTGD